MATKDAGFDEEEENVVQSNGLGAAVETAGAETPVSDPVTADLRTTGPADADHALTSPTGKEPHKEAPTYSEEFVNQLKAQHERDRQSRENRLREVENELKEKDAELKERNEKIQSLREDSQERDNIRDSIFSFVGDIGSPAKTNELVKKVLEYHSEAGKAMKLQKDHNELLKAKATIEKWYTEEHQKWLALKNDFEQKCQELEQTEEKLEEAISANGELFARCEVGERVQKSSVPSCLASMEWFDAFFKELKAGLQDDPIFDPSMLVFASLAELAVMERNSVSPCFEWKKLLADIGLVVANYMHQKKSAEGDVLKVLRNFAQAFQEMPILKKLKIVCKVPSLGEDFNTDEVKHRNNGSSIAKVLNWCIVEDGHVYCKAIVE
mgnify:CR=1 FL=1